MKIAISAAEQSGDLLASELITELHIQASQTKKELNIFGLAGDKMADANCNILWHTDEVSVMGFSEVFFKLPRLLLLRNKIIKTISQEQPDVFIGVDSPDFNLKIERNLKKKNIKIIHFISPSVWAWRQKRVWKIKKTVDLVICLFPFEVIFYQKHNIPAVFVGHPLADILKPRDTYIESNLLVLMPGSRKSEIKQHLKLMLDSANELKQYNSDLKISVALADEKYQKLATKTMLDYSNVALTFGQTHKLINTADLVIVASGTATLEVAITATPMVVIYKMSWLSYRIAKYLVKIPFVSLPNIIMKKQIVPELIQKQATVDNIVTASMNTLSQDYSSLRKSFVAIYKQLKRGSAKKSAQEILSRL